MTNKKISKKANNKYIKSLDDLLDERPIKKYRKKKK